jgi:hypothetical protein
MQKLTSNILMMLCHTIVDSRQVDQKGQPPKPNAAQIKKYGSSCMNNKYILRMNGIQRQSATMSRHNSHKRHPPPTKAPDTEATSTQE